jgi:hypothetical protein
VTALLAAIAIVLVGWFAAGTVLNVRRASALMRWMQGGLPLLGERTTVRWLGSTAVELVIARARPPFQQVTLVIFLEPRDMPWMWALARRGGRRDTLILRARLQRPPADDLEVLDPQSWSGKDALRRVGGSEWSVREGAGPGDLPVRHVGETALARADALVALARRAGLTVRRLSVRRAEPHLQLHVAPPSVGGPPAEFFQAVRALGERALAPEAPPRSVTS